MKPLKPGVHRLVARDGTVGVLIVDAAGRIVDLNIVGRGAAPARPSRRWVAASLADLREQARARAIRRALDEGDIIALAGLLD